MPTKITAIYENPQNPDTFEAGHDDQIALAKKIPGVQRIESAKVWPKEDGSATPAYRVLDLYFADYDAASRAVTTEEAAAFVGQGFELATGGGGLLFSDVEEG